MFRIPAVSGLQGYYKQSRFMQVGLTVAYALFAVAGFCALVSPTLTVRFGQLSIVYASFMLLGGVLASVGAATVRWAGEFTGLPLLGSSLAAYAVEIWYNGHDVTPLMTTANASLLLAVAVVLISRWRISLASFQLVHAVSQLPDDDGGLGGRA